MNPAAVRGMALVVSLAAALAQPAGTAIAAPSRPAAETAVKVSPSDTYDPCGTGAKPRVISKSQIVGAAPFSIKRLTLTVHVCFNGVLVWAPNKISSDGEYSIPCDGVYRTLTPGEPRGNEVTNNCFIEGRGTDERSSSLLWMYDLTTQTALGIPGETYEMWFVVSGSGVAAPIGRNLYCVVHPVPKVCTGIEEAGL